jgi:DUF177 domain-containing protein
MLLDLNNLRGMREHVQRTFEPAVLGPPDDEYRVAGPIAVSMDVEKAGGDVFRVAGRLSAVLELACSRCLEAIQVPVEAAFDLRYVPQSTNAGEGEREIAEEDLTTAYYREGLLDVGELLREQLQLALPMKPLCSDDCRGLCPECGAYLNRTSCSCAPRWEDPRLAPLKKLLNRDKES